MKRFLSFLVLFVFSAVSAVAFSQQTDTARRWRWVIEPKCASIDYLTNNLFAVEIDSLYGVVDTSGKFLIEPRYDHIGNTYQLRLKDRYSFSRFTKSKHHFNWRPRYGCFATQYDYQISFWSNRLIAVGRNGKIGFIDSTGREVVEPRFMTVMGLPERQYFSARSIVDTSCKTCMVDYNGKIIHEPIFDDDDIIDRRFGTIRVGKKYGVIDLYAKILAEPIYDSVKPYDDYQVMAYIGPKIVYVNELGATTDSPTPNDLPKRAEIFRHNGRYGLMGADGRIIIEPRCRQIWATSMYDFVTLKAGRFGITDYNGMVIGASDYTLIDRLPEGYFEVQVNSKKGVINSLKNIVFAPIFDEWTEILGDTVMFGTVNQKKGYVDLDGKFSPSDDPEFSNDEKPEFIDGYAVVVENGDYGIIDQNGNYVLEPQEESIWNFGNGFFQIAHYFSQPMEIQLQDGTIKLSTDSFRLYGLIVVDK